MLYIYIYIYIYILSINTINIFIYFEILKWLHLAKVANVRSFFKNRGDI